MLPMFIFSLTVAEHIWFYASLKGMNPKLIDIEMNQLLINVGLPHKRNEMAKTLSGEDVF